MRKQGFCLLSTAIIIISVLTFPWTTKAQEWERVYYGTLNGQMQVMYAGASNNPHPSFCDIDADGDYDLFVGQYYGNLIFFRNDGTAQNPSFTFVTENFGGNGDAPTFCDIDGDGDYDLFIGNDQGTITFYRNDGTPQNSSFTFVINNFEEIDVGYYIAPTFCDIDGDGDYDLFVGNMLYWENEDYKGGTICFYRNDGTAQNPSFTLVSDNYVGNEARMDLITIPAFCDIDGDGDYDLFIGVEFGNLHFYRNDGTSQNPSFTLVSVNYGDIDVGDSSAPTFCDTDGDGDYDLFVGEKNGNMHFYRNDGTSASPSFTLASESFGGVDVGMHSAPAFCDIDADGDYDLFVGEGNSSLYFYRNDGTSASPSFTLASESFIEVVGTYGVSKPAFCDIDADGDYDLFIGDAFGSLYFYRNDGTPENPSFISVSNNYLGEGGIYKRPAFCDIDADGDYDLFLGKDKIICFYRNDGTPENASFTFVTDNYGGINVTQGSTFTFCDIDYDGDYDLFVGEWYGKILFYLNDGTPQSPSFTLASESFGDIGAGEMSTPTFCDIDGDGDMDLFVGNYNGGIYHYRNISGNLVITPSSCSLKTADTQQFTVNGNTGSVTWSLSQNRSGGSITQGGLYTAGMTGGVTDIIRALDTAGKSNTATVNVITPVPVGEKERAIIIAGGGPYAGNFLWDVTNYLTNYAYRTFLYKGLENEYIYYLNPVSNIGIDPANPLLDVVDNDATVANLQYAISTWSKPGLKKLTLYLTDHGGDSYFDINQSEELSSTELDSLIDTLQNETNALVTVIYDACCSGSFISSLTPPPGKQRIVITSTEPDEQAIFIPESYTSFSSSFFSNIFAGASIGDAFFVAKGAMEYNKPPQTPQLDDNSNGIANEKGDTTLADATYLGVAFITGAELPQIGVPGIDPPELTSGTSATIWAKDVSSPKDIAKVWAIIIPPNYVPPTGNEPIMDLPMVELTYSSSNKRYEGTYSQFTQNGSYKIIFYAKDKGDIISLPKQLFIKQSGGSGGGCSAWDEVILKYQSYTNSEAAWTDVIDCYNEYVSE